MLALMDRMTVCGTLTPRDKDEVFAEWLAAVLVISKQLPCEAELNISPKGIIRQLIRSCGAKFSKLWPSIVQDELHIYGVLDYRVALPTALDITIRIAADISVAAERQDLPVPWLGMVEGCPILGQVSYHNVLICSLLDQASLD